MQSRITKFLLQAATNITLLCHFIAGEKVFSNEDSKFSWVVILPLLSRLGFKQSQIDTNLRLFITSTVSGLQALNVNQQQW